MLKQRTFNIVMVNGKHGSGALGATGFDKTGEYKGKAIVVKL